MGASSPISALILLFISIGLTCAQNASPADVDLAKSSDSEQVPILGKLRLGGSPKSLIRTLITERESHDFHAHLSLVQILELSGFKYELINVTSDDGYVTQLTRIVNPLARRRYMKRIPVVLYAGQGMAPAVFLMTDIGHQRPLVWPVTGQWPHQRQAVNRSLAVTLANNGYDVWLVPARGVDAQNRRRATGSGGTNLSSMRNIFSLFGKSSNLMTHDGPRNASSSAESEGLNWSKLLHLEVLRKLAKRFDSMSYWAFNQDDIVQFELGRQLEAIQKHTGCGRLSLISYSNGAHVSFAFMASRDKWARDHLDTVVAIGPAVFINKHNLVLGTAGLLGRLSPTSWPVLESRLDKMARYGLTKMCSFKPIRDVVCKLLLNQLYGNSRLFESRLELGMLEYLARPLSAHGLRQTLQASHSGRLSRYDYGPLGNLIAYEQIHPPAYALHNIQHQRLVFVTGGEDQIVGDESMEKLRNELAAPGGDRRRDIHVATYNHLDLLAGRDTLQRVNLPVLEILDDQYLENDYYRDEASSSGSGSGSPGGGSGGGGGDGGAGGDQRPVYKYHGDGSGLDETEQLVGGVFRDQMEPRRVNSTAGEFARVSVGSQLEPASYKSTSSKPSI